MDWPTSCDAAVEALRARMSRSEKDELASMARDDLFRLHFGLGMAIRNEFGLWAGNDALIESCSGRRFADADGVSMLIIERLWETLR